MASELTVLAHMLEPDRREQPPVARLHARTACATCIVEVVACFPIYRTYVNEQGWTADDRADRRARDRPRAAAQSGDGAIDLRLLPRGACCRATRTTPACRGPYDRRDGYPPADANEARERLRFAMKFQQYTGPLQAKGLEDTAFYRYNLLLSLNEVGGDPSRFGVRSAEFHELNLLRRATGRAR